MTRFPFLELIAVGAVVGMLGVGCCGWFGCFSRATLNSYVPDAVVVALMLVAWGGCIAKYWRAKA